MDMRYSLTAVLPSGHATHDMDGVVHALLDGAIWTSPSAELYIATDEGPDAQLVVMRRPSGVMLISRERDRDPEELVSLRDDTVPVLGHEIRDDLQSLSVTRWPKRWFVPLPSALAVVESYLANPWQLSNAVRWVPLSYADVIQERAE